MGQSMGHFFRLDFRSTMFSATCSCGGWSFTSFVPALESPSKVYREIENEFSDHLDGVLSRVHFETDSTEGTLPEPFRVHAAGIE